MTAITNEYMRQMCQWFHFVARALSLDYLDPLVNPDAATQRLIDTLNGSTAEGRREIYEVIV